MVSGLHSGASPMCRDGAVRSVAGMETTTRPLSRPRHGAMIAGVCAGLARHFDTTPTTVRLLAVASCLLPGPQVLAYVVLWAVIPRDPA